MQTLFNMQPALPPGFQYIPEFITSDEEQQLVNLISTLQLHTFIFQGYEAKRRVASFGYDYSFDNRKLTKGKDIPNGFDWLISRAANTFSLQEDKIAELLVIEYPIGAVINWHRDAPPFDVIAGISLAADCIFRLRPHDKNKQGRGAIIDVPVARRSAYLMSGESRSEWQHATKPVNQVRYSITLRTLR